MIQHAKSAEEVRQTLRQQGMTIRQWRNVSTTLRHLGFEFRLGLVLFALAG